MTRDQDMTRDRDIERVLEHWLTDGVNEMPDRVYQSIFDRVERQPQALAPRLLRRLPEMNSSLRWIAAAAAVLLIAVVGFAVLGRSSDSGIGGPPATPSPSPSPATAVAPTPSPTPPWDRPGSLCGELGCAGPLTAGTYTSKSVKPAVTYTLTSPWVNLRDWPEFFQLYPDTLYNRALAAAGEYTPYILIIPGPFTVLPSAQCAGGSAADEVEMDAAKLAEYLATLENVAATGAIPVTIGGLTGQQVDIALESGWTGCLPSAPIGEKDTGSERYRFIVLDRPGGGSVMLRLRSLADHDAFFAEAMPVIESFEFDLSQQPSPSP